MKIKYGLKKEYMDSFNRQSQFRADGTQTDVPTPKTEKPPVMQLSWLIVLDKESRDRKAREDSGILFEKEIRP